MLQIVAAFAQLNNSILYLLNILRFEAYLAEYDY